MSNKTVLFVATLLAACGLLLGTLSTAATVITDGQTTIIQTAPQPAPAPAPTATAPDKLSPGETNISLSLAKAELSKLGITNPTRAQLDAALHGGTVTTSTGSRVHLTGVVTQRQSGMGWGQIANAMGVKLGSVVSSSKTGGKHSEKNDKHDKHGSTFDTNTHNTAGTTSHEGGGHAGGGNGGGGHGGAKK